MIEAKDKSQIAADMDAAAIEATKQLKAIPKEHVKPVAEWMKANFGKAGYKRLSKALIAALHSDK